MFKPLSLFIGLRYTKAKKRSRYVSFISMMSMLGIALGVMVLITVLSVMNGFDKQIRNQIFALVPHITVTGTSGSIGHWQALEKDLMKIKGVTAVAPVVSGQSLLATDNVSNAALVNGIDASQEDKVSELGEKMEVGSLDKLTPGSFGIVLGEGIAANLNVFVGDKVSVITPQVNMTPVGVIPRFKQFKVVGIFHAGSGFGFDSGYSFINLSDAQRLFMLGGRVSVLQIKTSNLFIAPRIAQQIQKKIGAGFNVTDWTEQFGAFYHAVQMEKTMMFLILLLIVAIAAFNLVSSLMMAVNDKQADIAILRTIGATPMSIMRIFMIQGAMIGFIGTIIGLILGLLLASHVTGIVNFIQRLFDIQLINSSVYFVDFLPSDIQARDVIEICSIAFFMSVLATLYPAWRASRVQPAEALRYE